MVLPNEETQLQNAAVIYNGHYSWGPNSLQKRRIKK